MKSQMEEMHKVRNERKGERCFPALLCPCTTRYVFSPMSWPVGLSWRFHYLGVID